MELSARLSDQLALLAGGVGQGGSNLVEGLTTLVSTLTDALSGFAGLRLTLVHTGHPVRLTVLSPSAPSPSAQVSAVVTSLRLPLEPVSQAFENGGRLVVWSTVAGSLVDLAADLTYVLRRTGHGGERRSLMVELDEDLPLLGAASGVDGLDELATIHQAAGLLIGQGHHPDAVHETLRSRARDEGLSTSAWADQVVRLG